MKATAAAGIVIAALVLKARGHTRGWLLPISLGRERGQREWPDEPRPERLKRFIGWIAPAAKACSRELVQLEGMAESLRREIGTRRKNSKLPRLAALFLETPVVTTSIVAHRLKVSLQGADKLIAELDPWPRLISDEGEERIWTIGLPS